MDMEKWAIGGTVVIAVSFMIGAIWLSFKSLDNKKKWAFFELLYALSTLFGAFISTFSAMIDSKHSKRTYVALNLFYSLLTLVAVAVDITMEIWMRRERQYYLGNRYVHVQDNSGDIEQGAGDIEQGAGDIEQGAVEQYWHVGDHHLINRLTFRNRVRICLCSAGVGFAAFEFIWRYTWAKLEIGCLSLLPVTMALEIVATRAHKLYVGTVKVSCLVQYLGLGAPSDDDADPFFDVTIPSLVENDWAQEVVPLYSGCIRSVRSFRPGRPVRVSNTPGVAEYPHQAVCSSFTSYTFDARINNIRTLFTFIERTSRYDPDDWAIISKVDVIVLSFSLVDGNFRAAAIENEIFRLRRLAPGVPMLLVGDMDRYRAAQMTEQEVNDLILANAEHARLLVQTQGLECYMGVNHRSARFGDLLASTLAVFCSLY